MQLMKNSNRVGVLPLEKDGVGQIIPLCVVHGDKSISSYSEVSIFHTCKGAEAYEEHMTTNYPLLRS